MTRRRCWVKCNEDHTVTSKENENGFGYIGAYAKMARGDMVRFLAEEKIENPEDIRKYHRCGYVYREDLSGETEYVFERTGKPEMK